MNGKSLTDIKNKYNLDLKVYAGVYLIKMLN